jgi:hypothetical protein
MSLFGPPALQRVWKSSPVLDGGRTRLRIVIAGWGRLTLSYAPPDGEVLQRRLWFYGGEREVLLDVMPPGEVAVDVRNPFGGDATTLTVQADVAGIVELPPPQVPTVRLPRAPRLNTPRLRLGAISITAIKEQGSVEGET